MRNVDGVVDFGHLFVSFVPPEELSDDRRGHFSQIIIIISEG